MIELLLSHTDYLIRGFAINLLISVLSMGLGTVLGGALGWLRAQRVTALGSVAHMGTNVCRNVPSFVLLFYMASMIPSEVTISGTIMAVPLWIKATLALTFPVVGFTSDQSRGYFAQRMAGLTGARETFVVAWVQYFLIILMASATASVIGADEIVGRANIVISQNESPQFLLLTYLYVSFWFLAAGLALTSAARLLTGRRGVT
ncbi:hypothetical protein So717_24330 [Roseobacter cerasinus]|uniref:Amino acid ABC transporter permease n=1 Tax=Roseobacter cerasinus TaxID=2602289 RepID=A0A640VTC7_9RHOB|nr:hypothetical protein [Roseobacter cerasinus]GFE50680.1 hypothetical protein So717_24330 [Roseobacter cerasinus]